MKLLSLIILSFSITNACESPIINAVTGKCIGVKKGKFIQISCNSKKAHKLVLKPDGKFCAADKCLIRKVKGNGKIVYKLAKSGEFVYMDYDENSNSLKTRQFDSSNAENPKVDGKKITFSPENSFGSIRCSNSQPTPKPNDYKRLKNSCKTASNSHPTQPHPMAKIRQVGEEKFYVITGQTLEQCQKLCDLESWCVGFEYAVKPRPANVTFLTFQPRDCQLNYETELGVVDCEKWGLDYYEKMV